MCDSFLGSTRVRRWGTSLCLAIAAVTAGGCGNDPQASETASTIKIGVVESQTGPSAALGNVILGGLAVSIGSVNGANGFHVGSKRYKFEMVKADAASDPAKAVTAMTGLLRDSGAKFVFGPADGISVVSVAPIPGRFGALWLTSSSLYPALLEQAGINNQQNRYTFSDFSPLRVLADKMVANAVNSKLLPHKTAVLLISNAASYDAYVNGIVSAFTAQGINIPKSNILRYEPGTTDFSSVLTKIKQIHPDVFWAGSEPAAATTIAKQMVELGGVANVMMTLAASYDATTAALGSAPPFPYQYLAIGANDPSRPTAAYTKFLQEYIKVNGAPPPKVVESLMTIHDAPLKALIKAMQSAGTVTDVSLIAKKLAGTTANGVLGKIRFDEHHLGYADGTVCLTISRKQTCVVNPTVK